MANDLAFLSRQVLEHSHALLIARLKFQEARIAELEAALRELLGSYRSLAAGAKARGWVGSDFEQWDGPSMARSALGEKGKGADE